MPKELIFILGGARSGKSSFAEKLAGAANQVLYVATAEPLDDDMERRIANHRRQRPPVSGQRWKNLSTSILPSPRRWKDTMFASWTA